MNALGQIIARRIAQTGPINVCEYMQLCLSHPQHGYYMTRDPFGAQGDFTTAPEISQMFGELIGLWVAQVWLDQGSPSPFGLVELGPGRGTLLADAVRATRNVPGFHAAMQVWLVETSPTLRAKQAENLRNAHWALTIDELPNAPLFLIANEFFDSLPVHQFVRDGNGWREKMVGLADNQLNWGLAPGIAIPDLEAQFPNVPNQTLVETCPAGRRIAARIGTSITSKSGAALIIDYGDWHGTGDTLQALRHHKMTDPLADPGEADLTAHVNFSHLAKASNLLVWPLQTQGKFLDNLGISRRAESLRVKDPKAVASAHHRLTDPSQMGTLFKALCLTRADAPSPPGFA